MGSASYVPAEFAEVARADGPFAVIGVLRAPEIVVASASECPADVGVRRGRGGLDGVGAELTELAYRFCVGASVVVVGCTHSLFG